jgi:hypothetical protein
MPAKNELEVCYYNLKPSTANNTILDHCGINPNAIPPRNVSYSESSNPPTQTSATIFRSGGSEAFATSTYWSSTESPNYTADAQLQRFNNGYQNNYFGYDKALSYYVRAIRRQAV